MIQVNQVVCPLDAQMKSLKPYIAKKCRIKESDILSYTLIRQSLDGRKELCFKCTVLIETPLEEKLLRRKDRDITFSEPYTMIEYHAKKTDLRPIIVGFGPAGMFAALALAEAGCNPIVLERGKAVNQRVEDVNAFWQGGPLNPISNVQFGEGGAGTFSDGKLTTRLKDERNFYILSQLVEAGANPSILYQQHPHVGTDQLRKIVRNIRKKIEKLGGEIHFESQVEDLIIEDGNIQGVLANQQRYLSSSVILAIGHSATDTLRMLADHQILMKAKDFAVGVRIEHPQAWVNQTQYKEMVHHPALKSAEYRLTHTCLSGKGAYTFCMCPGGTVVNASSSPEQLVINGMSESLRDQPNANSAILIQVKASDCGTTAFAGLDFIEKLERKAYLLAHKDGHIPAQWVTDFLQSDRPNMELSSSCSNSCTMVDFHDLFDADFCTDLKEALEAFDKKMPGFAQGLMSAVESRSSSPLTILRSEQLDSPSAIGLYPCGEGAGYAGGIMSSALDGLRCAEAILFKINQ